MNDKKPRKGLVRLLPVPGHYIPGIPHVQMDVEPEVAAEYLSYTPAAFVEAAPVIEAGAPPLNEE